MYVAVLQNIMLRLCCELFMYTMLMFTSGSSVTINLFETIL
jgi:hypothetical protein